MKSSREMDVKKMKEVIGQTILEILVEDPETIYLDADLMSCIDTKSWAEQNPKRAINCGIAEANMVGIACGLAATGFKPMIHTFGSFASRRCYDQVYLSAGYAQNDITVLGSDPGICAEYNGGTHMPFEDMALYRALPTATVFDIADAIELKFVMKKAVRMKGVKYIRAGRGRMVKIYNEDSKLQIGKGSVLRHGGDAVIIASGIMVAEALEAADLLRKENIEITVVDMFTIKPLDRDCVLKYADLTGAVITAENHNRIGGLYSAVCELLAQELPVPVECVAVEDEFGEVGSLNYLKQRFQLNADHIVRKVRKALDRKISEQKKRC